MKSGYTLLPTGLARAPLALGLAALVLAFLLTLLASAPISRAGGIPTAGIEIIAGYNLIVDSNVESPSTYAPSVATVAGRVCNTSGVTATNVYAYIGNYSAGTPGLYPARDSNTDSAFKAQSPHLANTGLYAFTHIGGRQGLADARRFIGQLGPYQCSVQYWHFTYPRRGNPDNTGAPVWGVTHDPTDDLWLTFDVWANSSQGELGHASWRMTMRNEISAMANKIKPNPDGSWFNTNTAVVSVGDIITSNGILYELGRINQGFDNDGNFTYDYNAWLQPIGDPSYDPSCFRLIRTSGVVTVSRGAGNADIITRFTDKLYFTDLPQDNTGVRGLVYYTFMALDGPCSTALSPYQEVASGADNEKFNGDYGAGIPPVVSASPKVEIDKSGNITVTPGGRITYTVNTANKGTASFGLPMYNTSLAMSDSIPSGTTFTAGSLKASLGYTNTGVTIWYSINNGSTWTTTEPIPASLVTNFQVWLNDPLPAGASSVITFSVDVNPGFPPAGTAPVVRNCASASLGSAAPFAQDCTETLISGTNRLGDRVWRDNSSDGIQDAGEPGIPNIGLSLYYDGNGNGVIDNSERAIMTTTTDANGIYTFTYLPNGSYIVQVDNSDADLPYGYNNTTPITHSVKGLGTTVTSPYLNADFGFGPVLMLDKVLRSGEPAFEGMPVTYTISLANTRPGAGPTGYCQYTVWAKTPRPYGSAAPASGTGNAAWENSDYALGRPDDLAAITRFTNNTNDIAFSGFDIGQQAPSITKVELKLVLTEIQDLQAGDHVMATVYSATAAQGAALDWPDTFFTKTAGSQYTIITDVTGSGWTWGRFTSDTTRLLVSANKGTGSLHGVVALDSAAYIITTDRTDCGGPSDTVATLPLTDTYDATKLRFVSAAPPQSALYTMASPYTSTGIISWTNLGPLPAGAMRLVTVTFTALEPPGNISSTVTNVAQSTNSRYLDGKPVHAVSDVVTSTLQPTGLISGVVWSESTLAGSWSGATGYNTGDLFIPDVTVILYACLDSNGLPFTAVNTSKTCAGNTGTWTPLMTQTTGSNGGYAFTVLRDGYYYVAVDTASLPGGASTWTGAGDPAPNGTGTACPAGSGCDNLWGDPTQNLNPATSYFNPVNSAESITNVNFGYYAATGVVYGTIWEDSNRDGARQATESGLSNPGAGVTVTLRDNLGNTYTTTTTSTGYYKFAGLPAGRSYTVTVNTSSLPSGSTWTETHDPDAICLPTPTAGCNGQYPIPGTLAGGQISGSHDFGFYRGGSYSLGDTVYYDWNGSATQESNEEGIPNITVLLYRDTNGDGLVTLGVDAFVMTTTTSITGYYNFTNLGAYSYTVAVDTGDPDFPKRFTQTMDPDERSQVCTACDSQARAVITNASRSDIDFGYWPLGTGAIGDTVWRDLNGDGAQSGPLETGIVSITAWLEVDLNGDGVYSRVATKTTGANGYYLFTGLPDAVYRVVVDTADTDLPKDAFGNRYVPSTASSVSATITNGSTYLNADFGFMPMGAIGDTLYWDANQNAEQDWNEGGIPGIVVTLTNVAPITLADGTHYNASQYVLTRTTSPTGHYMFTGLVSGTYSVTVGPITGAPTLTGDPDTNGIPCNQIGPGHPLYSYCDGATRVEIHPGSVFWGADFGYRPTGVIGDLVWQDLNGNGVQDPGDRGIPGMVVTVTNGINTYTTTTDPSGYYSFKELPDGAWTVTFQQPANMTPTLSIGSAITAGVGSVGASATVVIAGGSISSINGSACANCSLNVDSGYKLYGDHWASGAIFFDTGNNGGRYLPGTDTPYSMTTVYLWTSTGTLLGSTKTDATGKYTFTNLSGGVNYVVSVNSAQPQFTDMTLTATPTETNKCVYCHNYDPFTAPITAGVNVTDLDFGFYAALDMGDLPNSYGTLLSSDGPRHVISSALYLGSAESAEGNGKVSALADADDYDDGVIRGSAAPWALGSSQALYVTVHGSGGYLVGWFDWNNDGQFSSGEMVNWGSVANGVQTLNVTAPSTGYASGQALAVRFRLYDGAPLSPSPLGLAQAKSGIGEDEDYYWTFSPTAVRFSSPTARAQGKAILVQWESFTTLDIPSFNLYRAESLNGSRIRLNESPIELGTGGSMGSYDWLDTAVTPGQTYYYWVEWVGTGENEISGPVQAKALYQLYLPSIFR